MTVSTTPLSPLAAQAVHQRFANRPSLFSVVFNALRNQMLEHYPTLQMDLRSVKLATPQPSGHWEFQLLGNVAVQHVLDPQLLDFSPQYDLPFYLTQKIPSRLKTPGPPYVIDMQVIARIIASLPATIHIYFQQALVDYWSATDAQGISHWQWLSEFLNGQMTAAAASHPGLTQTQQDMLSHVAAWPDLPIGSAGTLAPTDVYFIETTLIREGEQKQLLTPDLLLMRDQHVLLYSVAGAVEVFDSIDAFSDAWGIRMHQRFQVDRVTWRRNEPSGNVFERQAGLVLNQQLEDLGAITFQGHTERSLEHRLDTLTDPALLFSAVPQAPQTELEQLRDELPDWLKQASASDRFAYHRHLQDMARVLKQNQGRSFNEGIENIHDFSRHALRKQMQKDHGDHDPDDVVLDFSVAAGYPGGAGFIDHVRMSLTELAVKNLAGKPKGTLKLTSKTGQALPVWLKEDYVLGSQGLIQRVDIGTLYPQKVKELLLSDTADARRRENIFIRQLKVQLPSQALEYKIQQQHGVSAMGYRYVLALLGEMPSDRIVDGQEIVLRPLALCRKTGAVPDPVNNMFIIEPRNADVGPHLLYRPHYADVFHEYPTRQALLDAIAAPGDLQQSVLTWLTDRARPIYDHGGIKEPHIVHFTPGNEFGPYEKPAPATLAADEGAELWFQALSDGVLFKQLFLSTAQVLVDLAERDSVSNSENRWAIVLEGAGLLFNTLLLPLLRGPVMLAGWLLVLVSSLEQDLAGLDSDDPTTRELAFIDLLLNTAMVLLHATSDANRSPLPQRSAQDGELHLKQWRRPATAPYSPQKPMIRQTLPALPGEPPATGRTPLDFSRSLASAKASARLLEALLKVNVPWPKPLPTPEANGLLKGLYRIGDLWHASIGGLLFQVSVVPGFGDVYLVDPQRPHHPGFQLTSDGQGHWRLQRGARLEGGMPKSRIKQWKDERQAHLNTLAAQAESLRLEMAPLIKAIRETRGRLLTARANLDKQKKILRVLLKLTFADVTPEKSAEYIKKYAEQRAVTAVANASMHMQLEKYLDAVAAGVPVMHQIFEKKTEQMAADLTNRDFAEQRKHAAIYEFNSWSSAFQFLTEARRDLVELDSGEHIDELAVRVNAELSRGITHAYEEFLKLQKALLAIENKQIPVAIKVETLLSQADPALRQDLLIVTSTDQYISSVPLQQSKLLTLLELSINRGFQPNDETQFFFVRELMDPQILQSVLAHAEMRSRSGYSVTEQKLVLKDVLEHYKRIENAFDSLSEVGSGYIRTEYQDAFLSQFGDARTSLETQLADLILVDEGFAPAPAAEMPARPKTPSKKVIKTRNGNLVGDLRPSGSDAQRNVVDIIDPSTGQAVATYQAQSPEGVWEKVVEANSTQPDQPHIPVVPAGPSARSIKKIKADADKLIHERSRIEGGIRFEQRQLRDPRRLEDLRPWEWSHMLTEPAERLDALAAEIESGHAADANAVQSARAYRDEAQSMRTRGHEFCRDGYLLQRPRASNIKYLQEHGFVEITLVDSRVPLKAGDFLTEYAVHDKAVMGDRKPDNDNALWYAHFHYKTADAPLSPPDYAHLKTRAERKFTRKELFELYKKDARTIINLDKETISLALAEELFFIVK